MQELPYVEANDWSKETLVRNAGSLQRAISSSALLWPYNCTPDEDIWDVSWKAEPLVADYRGGPLGMGPLRMQTTQFGYQKCWGHLIILSRNDNLPVNSCILRVWRTIIWYLTHVNFFSLLFYYSFLLKISIIL